MSTLWEVPRLAFALCALLEATVLQIPMPVDKGGMPCLLFPLLKDDLIAAAADCTGIALVKWLVYHVRTSAAKQAAEHTTARLQALHTSSVLHSALRSAGVTQSAGQQFRGAPPPPPIRSYRDALAGQASGNFFQQPSNRSWGGCNDWASAYAGKGLPRCERLEKKQKPCNFAPCNGKMSPEDAARHAGVTYGGHSGRRA